MGAPRSRHHAAPIAAAGSLDARPVRLRGGKPRPDADGSSTPRTSISARATTTSVSRRAAQRERQFAAFAATVDLALAEKVDLVLIAGDLFDQQRPAAPLGRARRRAAQAAGRGARSGRSSSRAPTTATTARRSTAPTTSRRSPAAADDDLVTVLTPDHPARPPASPATSSSTAGASPRSAPRTARSRASTSSPHADGARDVARRAGPRLDRDPGQDRPRRRRHHDRGDRRERPRLPRPRSLALGASRARPAA